MGNELDNYIENRIKKRISTYCDESSKHEKEPSKVRSELMARGYPLVMIDEILKERKSTPSGVHHLQHQKPVSSPETGVPKKQEELQSKHTESDKPLHEGALPEKAADVPKDGHGQPHKPKKAVFTSLRENPRTVIALSMVLLFFLLVFGYFFITTEKGNGTCPYVSISDVRKVGNLYLERNQDISFAEMDQLVAAYLGKEDCTLIDSATVKALRKIEYG